MVFSPLFIIYGAVFLFALLLAYWRTLWVGKKHRVSVGLLSLAAAMFLLAAVWEKRLIQQQEAEWKEDQKEP